MTAYRIYEIARADGRPVVAGWGDHASHASARRAIERWGRITHWQPDPAHDTVDAFIRVDGIRWPVQLMVEPIGETSPFTVQ